MKNWYRQYHLYPVVTRAPRAAGRNRQPALGTGRRMLNMSATKVGSDGQIRTSGASNRRIHRESDKPVSRTGALLRWYVGWARCFGVPIRDPLPVAGEAMSFVQRRRLTDEATNGFSDVLMPALRRDACRRGRTGWRRCDGGCRGGARLGTAVGGRHDT
jgi:hypothetical protein